MSEILELKSLITDLGDEMISDAAMPGSGGPVEITHVALGDGNGSAYDARAKYVSLRNEFYRVPIETQQKVGPKEWAITAVFPPDGLIREIREIGFFTADNKLIMLWAESDIWLGHAGVSTFKLEHFLSFESYREGAIIVNAPEVSSGATEEFVNQVTIALASQAQRQFDLWEAHRAAHGHYPKGA